MNSARNATISTILGVQREKLQYYQSLFFELVF